MILKSSLLRTLRNCTLVPIVTGLSQKHWNRQNINVFVRTLSGLSTRPFPSSFRISPEVSHSIVNNSPVVALESAILTHGMPYPQNIETAFRVQQIIRDEGAIPATVGVLKGQLTVGLSDEEIEVLGAKPETEGKSKQPSVIKISRRDIPFAVSQKLSGGTTVAGTIIAATLAKIPIFVTGGLGGVHRGAELTFDISSDLRELGRNSIAVISAGVKSILDIGKTLEYLETEGVCVCVLRKDDPNSGNTKFPSFFTAESQYNAPYRLNSELQAAELVHSTLQFGLGSGVLIAVPIPKDGEAAGDRIENAIQAALKNANKLGVTGREITPFVLKQVNELTKGASLEANKILIENNAKVGAQIAVELAKLRTGGGQGFTPSHSVTPRPVSKSTFLAGNTENPNLSNSRPRRSADAAKNITLKMKTGTKPVVIGGSSLDLIFSVKEAELVSDGRTLKSELSTVPGGVGRNMAAALALLGHNPLLVSSIGDDLFGKELLEEFQNMNMYTNGLTIEKFPTAIYSAVLSMTGECFLGLGQMQAHDTISTIKLKSHENDIKTASIVIIDGNIPINSMAYVMKLCTEHNVPVWFEPTELRKAKKLLKVPREYWSCLTFLSPNLDELLTLSEFSEEMKLAVHSQNKSTINCGIRQCFEQFVGLQLILLTHGKNGFSVIYRKPGNEPSDYDWMDFPAPVLNAPEEVLASVSGAGDCLNAGFISGLLQGQDLHYCAIRATECAKKSLLTHFNVPQNLKL